jgi:hypothetical protein
MEVFSDLPFVKEAVVASAHIEKLAEALLPQQLLDSLRGIFQLHVLIRVASVALVVRQAPKALAQKRKKLSLLMRSPEPHASYVIGGS